MQSGSEQSEQGPCLNFADLLRPPADYKQTRILLLWQQASSHPAKKRRGRDSNPRYSLLTVRRFSKPSQQSHKAKKGKDLQEAAKDACAPACAREAKNGLISPELEQVIKAWPELPQHIKAAIKALIQTHHTENR